MSYTQEDLNLWRPEVYEQRFQKHLTQSDTLNEAWEATERDFKKIFGTVKYKSYESFRLTRRRWVKTNKEKKCSTAT